MRRNQRKYGDGYITRQGYHLVYDGTRYVPAHRLLFPDLEPDKVVHHIDGNKLNNSIENLLPMTKKDHRELHGQLERLSYYLIQNGLIEFDGNRYHLSTSMKKFIDENPVNSGEAFSVNEEGNPEPSQTIKFGRCNDYPEKEYAQVSGSAGHPNEG